MAEPQGHSLARNVTAAFGGEAIQALLSVAIFFGIFFQLSDEQWGLYVAVTATGLILGTLANLGSQELLLRNVSRGADLANEWGQTLVTQLGGTVVGIAVGLAVRPLFFAELDLVTSGLLLAINIFAFWTVEATVRVGQAIKDLAIGTQSRLLFALARLGGVAAFFVLGTGEVSHYALFAFPLALAGAVTAILVTSSYAGAAPRLAIPSTERLRRGLPFVGTAGAQDLLAGFDRPLLSANGFVVETGQYGIADRVVRMASIPTMALVRATAADFFQTGEKRDRQSLDLAVRFAKPAIAYGMVASLGLIFGAWLFDDRLPDRFDPVLPMLAALAALTTLHAVQLFPANLLTGTDRQTLRLVLYLFAVGVNIGLNIMWIPRWNWRGAAAATLVAESLLAITLWLVAWKVSEPDKVREDQGVASE